MTLVRGHGPRAAEYVLPRRSPKSAQKTPPMMSSTVFSI